MRILISNDDGILSPGLAALYSAVADMGEVHVVAPDSPQSAAGHSITLRYPLVVQAVHIHSPQPFVATSVNGRPADCVRLAIRNLLPSPPDLVLSGINEGANVGINVFYSGTVAAAAEAAMFSIPAVAFSASMVGGGDFARAAAICRQVLEDLLAGGPARAANEGRGMGVSPMCSTGVPPVSSSDEQRNKNKDIAGTAMEHTPGRAVPRGCGGLAAGDLVNVNIPELNGSTPRGVRVVRQSTAGLEDLYHPTVDAEGRQSFKLGGTFKFLSSSEEDTDVIRLAEGYVTVTPLHVDMTNHARLEGLKAIGWREVAPGKATSARKAPELRCF